MPERWQEIANEIALSGELLNPTGWFKEACKRAAAAEAVLEYIRMRYGALDGVDWNRMGFLEGEPRRPDKAEGREVGDE